MGDPVRGGIDGYTEGSARLAAGGGMFGTPDKLDAGREGELALGTW